MRNNFSHEHNTEHNKSKIRTLHYITIVLRQNSLKLNYAIAVVNTIKIVYELWHNCSSYEHNIEHNRQIFRALLKSIIDKNLRIIGHGLIYVQNRHNMIKYILCTYIRPVLPGLVTYL